MVIAAASIMIAITLMASPLIAEEQSCDDQIQYLLLREDADKILASIMKYLQDNYKDNDETFHYKLAELAIEVDVAKYNLKTSGFMKDAYHDGCFDSPSGLAIFSYINKKRINRMLQLQEQGAGKE